MASYDRSHSMARSSIRKGMDQFATPRQSSAEIQHELSKARKAADANTARLRALRLAKEAADRHAAIANPPPETPRASRKKT